MIDINVKVEITSPILDAVSDCVSVSCVPEDESILCTKLKENRHWRPYCLTCSSMYRMFRMEYGFRCIYCNNKIKWDLTKLAY